MSIMPGPIMVVGTGAAGLATVEGLRRHGYDGPISWVGAEAHLPYDRPPLSKQILTGAWGTDRLALCTEERIDALDVDLRTRSTVAGLDLPERLVHLDDGTTLPFGTLVAATGVRPRTLPSFDGVVGVHTIRTIDDVLALRAELGAGRRVVVIGGGFLGTESAASARTVGAEVHLLEPEPVPLAAAVGTEVGEMVARVHRDHGVDVRTGPAALVTGLNVRDGAIAGVVLADGTRIAADLVVVAIGSVPATEWLSGTGIDCADGVRCDEYCAAAPGVYAVGDVASWQHVGFGSRVRLEHRTNAGEQGEYVAKRILGLVAEPFKPVPYFWSDQYDLKIQAFGLLRGHDEMRIVDGAVEDGAFLALYRKGSRLAGVLGVRKARALGDWRSLIGQDALWSEIDTSYLRFRLGR